MISAVYPGSFDPFTNGHLDMTERSARIFDEIIVAILVNSEKKAMFSVQERVAMTAESVAHLPNVRVESFDGLLVDFMKKVGSRVIVRGLRALSDFEYEFQIAQLNRHLSPDVETFFMVTNAQYSYLSSRGVKDVFEYGGRVDDLLPPPAAKLMNKRRAETVFV